MSIDKIVVDRAIRCNRNIVANSYFVRITSREPAAEDMRARAQIGRSSVFMTLPPVRGDSQAPVSKQIRRFALHVNQCYLHDVLPAGDAGVQKLSIFH